MSSNAMNYPELRDMIAADLTGQSGALQPGQTSGGQLPPQSAQPPAAVPEPPAPPPAEQPPVEQPPAVPAEGQSPPAEPVEDEDDFSIEDLEAQPPKEGDEAPKPEAAEGQKAEGEPQAAEDPDREIGALLATPRGKRIYAAFKTTQTLAKTPDEGGIGHAPNAEQVKQYFKDHVVVQRMNHDFESGDPNTFQTWAAYWFGPVENGMPRNGSVEAVKTLPHILAQINPDAFREMMLSLPDVLPAMGVENYTKFATPVIMQQAQRFFQLAAAATDPEDKRRFEDAAKLIEHDRTGVWRDANGSQAGQPAVPQQSEEVRRLQEQVRQLTQQVNSTKDQGVQARKEAMVREIQSAMFSTLRSDVEKALDRAKPFVKDTVLWDALVDKFSQSLRAQVQKNEDGLRLLNFRIKQALENGRRDDIPNIVKEHRTLYASALQLERPKYLKAAGVSLKASAEQTAAQLQQSSQKVSPSPGVQRPADRSVPAGGLQRQDGETTEAFMRRQFLADMAGGLSA